MIKRFTKYEIDEVISFILPLMHNKNFSNPDLYTEEDIKYFLNHSLKAEGEETFLIYDRDLIGIFSFIILPDENYIELTLAFSKEVKAYEEIFEYLTGKYKNYKLDLYFNPTHFYLNVLVNERNGILYPEQFQMKLNEIITKKHNKKIIPYKKKYMKGYCNIHSTDLYYTAEKVIETFNYISKSFYVFLAIEKRKVVGYVDIRKLTKEKDSYFINDILVVEEYRGQGIGQALLKEAFVKLDAHMFLLSVDTDNKIAQHTYEAVGFRKVELSEAVFAELKL